MDVGTLTITLTGNNDKLTAAINKAVKDVEGFAGSAKKAEQQAGTAFQAIGAAATQMAAVLGASFSIAGMVAFVRQSVDVVARMNDLAQQTDISASTLLGLKSVAEEAGSSIELFARAGFMAQRQLSEIKNTSDPVYQAITKLISVNKEMGLTFQDLQGMNTGEFLQNLAKMLQNVTGYQEKLSIATAFFGGRLAKEMIPVLDQMARGFDRMLTDEQIARVDDFTDRMTRFRNLAMAAVVDQLVSSIDDLTRAFDDLVGSLGKLPEYTNAFVTWLSNSMPSIQSTERELLLLVRAFKYLLQGQAEIRQFFMHPFKPDPTLDAYIKEKAREIEEINDKLGMIGQPSSHTPVPEAAPRGRGGGGVGATQAVLEQKKAIEAYIDALKAQNTALLATEMAFSHTEAEVKAFTLEQEKNTFITKLQRDALYKVIPPELLKAIDDWNAKIVESTRRIEEQKKWIEEIQAISKAWVKEIDDVVAAEEKWAEIKMDPASLGMDDLSKELDEISRKYMKLIVDAEAAARAARALPEEVETVTRRLLIDRAMEQVRARVKFMGPDVDPDEEARKRAEKLGEDVGNAITGGIRNTLMGIETGQMTVGEGMKRMLQNIALELQFLMFDESILKPINAFAKGFVKGLFGAISDAAEKGASELGESIGKAIKGAMSSIGEGASSWISKGIGFIGSLFGFGASTAERGGLLQYARGGAIPILAHSGEFVMSAPAVQRIGQRTLAAMNNGETQGGGNNTQVIINGSITPNDPNARREEIIQVVSGDFDNQGRAFQTLHQRSSMLSKG